MYIDEDGGGGGEGSSVTYNCYPGKIKRIISVSELCIYMF